MSRALKLLIYGLFYLAILGAVGYGVYASGIFVAPTCFDQRQNQHEEEADCGGPCVPCAIKKLQPIRAEAKVFGIDGNTNAVLTFSNPNINYGAQSFVYALNFYDQAKQKIFSLTHSSFIYPAEAKKIVVEPNLHVDARQISGPPEVIVGNPQWAAAAQFSQPEIQIRQAKTEIVGKQATVSAVFANREAFTLSRVTIGMIVVNKISRLPLGASKTILQNLQPFEERTFKIIAPLNGVAKAVDVEPVFAPEVLR